MYDNYIGNLQCFCFNYISNGVAIGGLNTKFSYGIWYTGLDIATKYYMMQLEYHQ